jgi:hypothetical protein
MENKQMILESLKELVDKEPFQPFRIVTASGDKYEIVDPHLVAIGKDQIFIYTAGDHFVFVRNRQITAVESIRTAA